MAPQELEDFNSSYNFTVQETSTDSAPAGLEKPAQKYATLILMVWAISTTLIFTQRILLRKDPFTFNILGRKISVDNPDLLTKKQVKKIDGILFTVNYSLISFLMVLQFFPGKVKMN